MTSAVKLIVIIFYD